ncbi:diguanylate cyclase/phosphodiesterase (GGDEF & EAL domains) with PAS/PAC sensor(s) [hydrothermal vent metagenome]|uniref:Diguanylate cyclase/phosphodiesterase (GGDEF & EAL domains) with PAS/PAC sensor(S) n=1 Tax=hydrothermal vent metagenome TaxID=652676 RepID=A0A1W1D6C5_9ZZZZ
MGDELEKKVTRLERKVKAFEQTFQQQNLIAQKYNEALLALQEKEQFLSTVIESNKNAIIAINQHHIVTIYNQSAEKMFGYSKEEMLHKNSLKKIIPPYLQERHLKAIEEFIERSKGNSVSTHYHKVEGQKKDGIIFPIRIGFGTTIYNDGDIVIVANIEDLSDKENIVREKEIMKYRANHDVLTSLPNRLMLQERLKEIVLQQKNGGTGFALLYIDLDKFKAINDTLGHDYGDEVLKIAAKRMSNTIREEDLVVRLGGDEFIIILQHLTNKDVIKKLVVKILNTIEEKIRINHHILSISASIGVAIFPNDGKNEIELMKNADDAMYDAKQSTTYNFIFYDELKKV